MERPQTKLAPDQAQDCIGSKVLAAATNGVVGMIQRHNGDVDTIFGRSGLSPGDIVNPNHEINLRQYCCLFEEAARQTTNENFGLRFGNGFKPKQLGPIGYLAVNSPSMASAVRNLVDYFPGHQDNSILSLERDRDIFYLNYQIVDPRIRLRRQDAELSLGMFCNLFKHCLGDSWTPLEVYFEHNQASGPREHECCFGAPVYFGRRTNTIVFRGRDLDAIMPETDPYLFAVMEPMLAERRTMRANPAHFITSIREHIRMRLGDQELTLEGVAQDLDMSVPVLQCQLRKYGISFQNLLQAARQELALRYVQQPDMQLTEVAFALGYSEQSAFSRAFRQWTGMSPRLYRKTFTKGLMHQSGVTRDPVERALR